VAAALFDISDDAMLLDGVLLGDVLLGAGALGLVRPVLLDAVLLGVVVSVRLVVDVLVGRSQAANVSPITSAATANPTGDARKRFSFKTITPSFGFPVATERCPAAVDVEHRACQNASGD